MVALTGCAGSGAAGVMTLTAIDREGRNPGNFNFAVVDDSTGKVAWSGVPAEGSTVRGQVKGGSYRIIIVASSGAACVDTDVDGDESVTVHIGSGGAVRGEARKGGQPFAAAVFMPIPGKKPMLTNALSYIVHANADGRFQIDRLPPGKWILAVGSDASGYKEVEVEVKEGKPAEIGYVEVP